MYDEQIKKLRELASIPEHCENVADCDQCPKEDICLSFSNKRIIEVATQAADAIEELSRDFDSMNEANIALYGALPKWIPVTERLPKEGEFVLVYGDLYPNKHDGGVIAVSKRMDWNYWQGFGRERNISHWMQIPPPPTAEEGE